MAVMGCGLAGYAGLGASPTAPIKPTPGPIALRTATSPVPASACPEAAIEGTLIEHPVTGLGLLDQSGRVRTPVVWPTGYRANPSIGSSILFDASGQLVAYTGERVAIQATTPGPAGPLVVCGTVRRIPFDGSVVK